MRWYWGDLHNHCAVSYGHGTIARALDNARQHLDFSTLTGHAFWPDLPMDLASQNRIIGMHLGGFAKLQHFWPELLRALAAANQPGRFVTLPSYEWHSMEFGDYNCYAPGFDLPLLDAPDVRSLARAIRARVPDFLLLPHHCGYTRGQRGTNWSAFDDRVSPLVEVYSNHGSCEADDAPYDYYHSMGPRVGESLVRSALQAGHRFGFYASTDSHDGYPGHYGHGRVGVLAERLDLPSIWLALKERRTLASTGARIGVMAALHDAGIGQVAPRGGPGRLEWRVEGNAAIQSVDLIIGDAEGWSVRRRPGAVITSRFTPGRHKIKVECGWGRADALSSWQVDTEVIGGRLLGCEPCFRHNGYPMSELEASERLVELTTTRVRWQGRALPNPAGQMGGTHFSAGGTQAIVLEVEGDMRTRVVTRCGGQSLESRLVDLAACSLGRQRAGFGSAAFKVHRAVPEREFVQTGVEDLSAHLAGTERGYVYLRITQADGHTVWVSPIWWE